MDSSPLRESASLQPTPSGSRVGLLSYRETIFLMSGPVTVSSLSLLLSRPHCTFFINCFSLIQPDFQAWPPSFGLAKLYTQTSVLMIRLAIKAAKSVIVCALASLRGGMFNLQVFQNDGNFSF